MVFNDNFLLVRVPGAFHMAIWCESDFWENLDSSVNNTHAHCADVQLSFSLDQANRHRDWAVASVTHNLCANGPYTLYLNGLLLNCGTRWCRQLLGHVFFCNPFVSFGSYCKLPVVFLRRYISQTTCTEASTYVSIRMEPLTQHRYDTLCYSQFLEYFHLREVTFQQTDYSAT